MSIPESPSAFIRFCKARRPGLKAAHPGASFRELNQLLGAEWSALGAGRGPYVAAKAAEDEATGYSCPANDLQVRLSVRRRRLLSLLANASPPTSRFTTPVLQLPRQEQRGF